MTALLPSSVLLPALLIGLLAGVPGAARAQSSPPSESEQAAGGEQPHVELERLLQLPSSLDYGVERRGDATRGEWRERFRDARASLDGAQAALQEAQQELEGIAEEADAWQLAPPGAGEVSDAPLSYRLRQEIRRQRAEVTRAERRLQELEVEADLAGVPADWRR